MVEEAVQRYYGQVQLPEELIKQMQEGLEESIRDETTTATAMRQNIQRRLTELNSQEERLLDLAMDGGLPQDKIKERLGKIERERHALQDKKQVTVAKIIDWGRRAAVRACPAQRHRDSLREPA